MSRARLMQEMSVEEVLGWMAYETSIVPETHDRLIAEIRAEQAQTTTMTEEQEAEAIRKMFASIMS